MRMMSGAITVALGLAAQPALAREGAAPAGGATPLLTTAITAAPATIVALPTAATAIVGQAPVSAPVSADAMFRLPALTLSTTTTKSSIPTTELTGGFRHRFTGNMMEYYPVAGSGFHISGGSRMFARRNFMAETGDSARGALSVTRVTTQSAVTKTGFRRFNPVATAGYTVPLSSQMQIGVEAGAMMNRAYSGTPGVGRHNAAFRAENGFHPDAIANLVFGMHF